MKKTLLTTLGCAAVVSGFAQSFNTRPLANTPVEIVPFTQNVSKTTGDGDTLILTNIGSADTMIVPFVFSAPNYGFTSGPNSFGDKAFAERYDFDGADSSLKVIGAVFLFTGEFNPATTKTITAKAWNQGASVRKGNRVYDGYPNTTLASSASVSITNLGINMTGGNDSLKVIPFTTPTSFLTDSFYVGYEISYSPTALNGDTIGVVYTTQADRNPPVYTVSGSDTLLYVANAVMDNSGAWADEFTENTGLFHNFAMFPIVEVNWITNVKGIKNGNLSFNGTYPNPATDKVSVKFGLKNATEVNIIVADMTGRTVKSISKNGAAGEQIISFETNDLPAGNYICVIRTSGNDGVASKFTVAK